MERVCDFSYYTDTERSHWGSYNVRYYITFNVDKLLNNFGELRTQLKRTKFYKSVESVKEIIDAIPDTWMGFDTYDDMMNTVNWLIRFSKSNNCTSQSFEYEFIDDIREEVKIQNHFYKNMKCPVISFVEHNGWENETWKWWFDVPKDLYHMSKVMKFRERLKKLGIIDQKVGKTFYSIMLGSREYESVNFDSEACSYMSANTFVNGEIKVDEIDRLIAMNDDDLFDALYKGGVMTIFKG